MNNFQQLRAIKFVHSLIWVFMVTVIFYVVYCGIFNTVNLYTWISIAIVLIEGLVLLLFKMSCPLTILARKYSDSTKDNFDIYLPNTIARYNKQIFTSIFLFGVVLVIMRSI